MVLGFKLNSTQLLWNPVTEGNNFDKTILFKYHLIFHQSKIHCFKIWKSKMGKRTNISSVNQIKVEILSVNLKCTEERMNGCNFYLFNACFKSLCYDEEIEK